MVVVMQQKNGRCSARLAIDAEKRAQFSHERIRRRHSVASGARRTSRRALTAAGTDLVVDYDVIAGRRDRTGRAEIETAMAAHDARARMSAQRSRKVYITWLVEGAD